MDEEDKITFKQAKETVENWIKYWMDLHGLTREECIEIFSIELQRIKKL